jgi:hypothetical protein
MRLGAKLEPTVMVEAVWNISPQRLWERGLRALIFDLDNTVVDWSREYLRPEVLAWARACRKLGLAMCICTNAGCKPRVRRIAETLGACYLAGAGKPRLGTLKRAVWLLRAAPQQAAVVGDQVFMDIWGGNRLGMMTFLVRPLSNRDFFATRALRQVEKRLLRGWRQKGKDYQAEF